MSTRSIVSPVSVVVALLVTALTVPVLAKGRKGAKRPAKPAPAKVEAADAKTLSKPIKRVIGAIRYGKNDLALKQFDGDAQSKFLLGSEASKFTADQKAQFIRDFHGLFAALAFPRVKGDFQKLETILYGTPSVSGSTAKIGATIVILHPAKKQEIKTTFDLTKVGADWKIVDVTVRGDKSMLTNIRDEQIKPLLKEGGPKHLLGLMTKRLQSIKKR